MSKYKRRAGEQFGSWHLVEPLGSGGNAEVWKATGSDGHSAALKVLHNKNPNSEPFKRFQAEVTLLLRLGATEGLLPIIDANLELNASQSFAWFAMPIATPIRKALEETPAIEMVVRAVADIATCLAKLNGDGISHRDIKPDNLYRYEEQWAVGDFGLASYPDKEALTAEGKKLGPLYYLAPEMLFNPDTAAGPPADVYSLAKALWVLATGQNYPPPGQHRVEIPALTLSSYVTHSRAGILDRLLEHATAHDPHDRPTMGDVANELNSWLLPSVERPTMKDMSDLFVRIAARTEPKRRKEEEQHRLLEEYYGLQESLLNECTPLANYIAATLRKGRVVIKNYTELLDVLEAYREKKENRIGVHFRDGVALTRGAITIWAYIPGSDHVQLVCGVGSRVFEDGIVSLEATHFVRLRCQEQSCPPGMLWSSLHNAARLCPKSLNCAH